MRSGEELAHMLASAKNLSKVLRLLLAGHTTRIEIAKACGLDRATVTREVARLRKLGLVYEGEQCPRGEGGSTGRPRVRLELTDSYWVLTLHVGYRAVDAGAVSIGGRVLARFSLSHSGRFSEVVSRSTEALRAIMGQLETRPLGLGITVGGLVDLATGHITYMPYFNWHDADLRGELAREIELPSVLSPVALASAQSNLMFGLVAPQDTFAHLYIGSVCEYALVHQGEPWTSGGACAGNLGNLPVALGGGEYGTVREAISDLAVLTAAHREGIIAADTDFEDVIFTPSGQVQRLLDERARRSATLIKQLCEVAPVPKVVISASLVRQPHTVGIIREQLARIWPYGMAPQIVPDRPVALSSTLAPAAAYFQTIFEA